MPSFCVQIARFNRQLSRHVLKVTNLSWTNSPFKQRVCKCRAGFLYERQKATRKTSSPLRRENLTLEDAFAIETHRKDLSRVRTLGGGPQRPWGRCLLLEFLHLHPAIRARTVSLRLFHQRAQVRVHFCVLGGWTPLLLGRSTWKNHHLFSLSAAARQFTKVPSLNCHAARS